MLQKGEWEGEFDDEDESGVSVGVVRETAECRMETFNSQRENLRSMGETQEMGYQTERRK